MKKLICITAFVAICVTAIAQERIPMTLEKSGIYTIPCEVNGLKLKFVFDTGAADVHLSLVEAVFMLKNGYIDEDDFFGTGTYSMADGSISENAMVNLKTIKIGNKTIHNVQACVSSTIDASLLLGQSAIKKLGDYSINGSYLVLEERTGSTDDTLVSNESSRDSIIYDLKGNVVSPTYTGNGKKVYSTGSVVEATFKNGLEYGYGKYTSKDGKFWYEGNFEHGEGNGKGKMFSNGALYEGTFVDTKWDGKGRVIYENGNTYTGDFKSGKMHGQGTFEWKAGDKYVGGFVNGYREGYGTYTWANGEKYEGYHVKGQFEGRGAYYYNDGCKYVGEFSSDQMEGQGIFTWPSGDKYVGNFYDGFPSGNGTYYWENGDRYEGAWIEGERTGKGTFYFFDGRKYVGDFVRGIMEGYGTFTWPNGEKYVGAFKEGYRTGYGTYTWKDGSKYQGYWLEGKQDGNGTYYYSYGGTKTGTWKDGEYVNTLGYTLSSPSTTNSDTSASSRSYGYVDNSCNKTRNYSYTNNNDDYDYRGSSLSTNDDVDYYIAQTTTDLNLRKGPGVDYDVVTRIPRGGYVFLSTADAGESFRKVLYVDKNEFGYVSKNYLTNFSKVEVDASGNLQVESKNYKTTADIKITNRTNTTATIAIGSLTYTFSPYQTRTIKDIKPGRYKTMASSPGVMPYVGYDTVEGGYEYSWEFYIETITR